MSRRFFQLPPPLQVETVEAPLVPWVPPARWADDLVALGLCSWGLVQFASEVSLCRLLVHDRRIVGPVAMEGPLVDRNRSRLVRDFLEDPRYASVSWLLQVDGDAVVPANVARVLVTIARDFELDVLAGQSGTIHGAGEAAVVDAGRLVDVAPLPPERVALVDRVGAGCLLASRQILERLALAQAGGVFEIRAGEPGMGSEDWSFCARVRAAGGRIGITSWVPIGHLKSIALLPSAFEVGRELTRTLSKRREVITELYGNLIERTHRS